MGSLLHSLGPGGGEIIKVLSENEDMVPAPGVAGDPPPRTQGPVTPPQSLVHSRGEPAPLACK